MKSRKPTAYIAPHYNGWFMLERSVVWIAEDTWGNKIAYGSTRRECEAEARYKGYSPVRDYSADSH